MKTIHQYIEEKELELNFNEISYVLGCADTICSLRDIKVNSTPDPRFGKVNMYPESILDEIFELRIN